MLQTLQEAYSKQKMSWSRVFEQQHMKYNPELLEYNLKRGHGHDRLSALTVESKDKHRNLDFQQRSEYSAHKPSHYTTEMIQDHESNCIRFCEVILQEQCESTKFNDNLISTASKNMTFLQNADKNTQSTVVCDLPCDTCHSPRATKFQW